MARLLKTGMIRLASDFVKGANVRDNRLCEKIIESVIVDQPEIDSRLSDEELALLDELLATTGNEECMSAEELDGFCCALAVCSERVPKVEWLSEALGEPLTLTKTRIGPTRFASLQQLIDRHFASVRQQLEDGESFAPIVNTDEKGRTLGYGWAVGFACGMGLREDAWAPIEDDDDLAEAFVPIMDLVDEAHDQGDAPPDLSIEECSERFNEMLDGVFDAYQFFRKTAAKPNHGPKSNGPGRGAPPTRSSAKRRPR